MTTEFQSFSELYPGRFLKADLFNGQPCTYTIVNIWREEIEGDKGKEAKVLVSFNETPLQLVLAKVNAEAIKAMFGASVPNWIGKRITFYGTTTIMPFPKRPNEPCIRVYGSPDIDTEIRSEWTPPRRKPVVQILKPTASEIVTKALAAAAKATTPAAAKAVEDRATALQAQGKITEAELTAILRALPTPTPEPTPEPEADAATDAAPAPAADGGADAADERHDADPAPVHDTADDGGEPGGDDTAEPAEEPLTEADHEALAKAIKAARNAGEVVRSLAQSRGLSLRSPIGKLVKTKADIAEIMGMLQ